jgi:hypothetical protein
MTDELVVDFTEPQVELTVASSQREGEFAALIETAKRYPRNVTQVIAKAKTLATLTVEVAESCFYALPRGGRTITGPSIRLAEIMATAYGNLRVGARIISNDGRSVTLEGYAWDMESNLAVQYPVVRRITDRNGKVYNDDMTTVTIAAGASVARRNAILGVIPRAYVELVLEQARRVAAGDVKTLAVRRADAVQWLVKRGAKEANIYHVLGVRGIDDVTLEHMVLLSGFATALRDDTATVDELFPDPPVEEPEAAQPQAKPERGLAAVKRRLKKQEEPPVPEPATVDSTEPPDTSGIAELFQ